MRVAGIPYIQGRNASADADGKKYGIAIHNTSNSGSAADEASYATRRTDGVSSHFYVDRTQVIQSLDTTSRAGHAGSSNGNQNAIAVEITGTNAKSRQWWLDNVDWAELGRVLAAVCKAYGIAVRRASVAEMQANPKVRAIYSHDDMRRAWGGTTHTDPGPNFPWDRLFSSVNAALKPSPSAPAKEPDVEQTDKLSNDTGNPQRLVGDFLGDVQNHRNNWELPAGSGELVAPPKPTSRMAKLDVLLNAAPTLVAQIATLAGKDFTDEPAIVAGVLAGLDPAAIAAAIPTNIAKQVADELHARLEK